MQGTKNGASPETSHNENKNNTGTSHTRNKHEDRNHDNDENKGKDDVSQKTSHNRWKGVVHSASRGKYLVGEGTTDEGGWC